MHKTRTTLLILAGASILNITKSRVQRPAILKRDSKPPRRKQDRETACKKTELRKSERPKESQKKGTKISRNVEPWKKWVSVEVDSNWTLCNSRCLVGSRLGRFYVQSVVSHCGLPSLVYRAGALSCSWGGLLVSIAPFACWLPPRLTFVRLALACMRWTLGLVGETPHV